nr:DUF1524 domain-containing protein [Planctomycetota bacterium]
LLEPSLNREADQLGFREKTAIYARSCYALPRSVAANDWGAEAIRRRSEAYAKRARHIWKVDFVST